MEVVYTGLGLSPEGTSKLHDEVAQMSVVPTPATLPSLSQPVPMTSWCIPYDQLTEQEETKARFTDGSTEHASTTSKWKAVALQLLPGISLKNSGENKPSQWAGLWAVHLFAHSA